MLGFLKKLLGKAPLESNNSFAPPGVTVSGQTYDQYGAEPKAASEAYFAKHFPTTRPADLCQKFITHSTLDRVTDPLIKACIIDNTSAARLFSGMGYGFGKADGQPAHNVDPVSQSLGKFVLPDSLCYAGPGYNGDPAQEIDDALIAKWEALCEPGKPWYPKRLG